MKTAFKVWDTDENKMRYDCALSSDGIVQAGWGKDKYNWIPLFSTQEEAKNGTMYECDILNKEVIIYWDYDNYMFRVKAITEESDHTMNNISLAQWYENHYDYDNLINNIIITGNRYETPEQITITEAEYILTKDDWE
jgi:hypothetical protein